MAQEIFERYEKKYVLTSDQYSGLCKYFNGRMAADEYGIHTISNLYFDTKDYELIRRSIDRPVYKEKLRLRAYGKRLSGEITDGQIIIDAGKEDEINLILDGFTITNSISAAIYGKRLYYNHSGRRNEKLCGGRGTVSAGGWRRRAGCSDFQQG